MADQHRWFKLWYTACSDDALQQLPPAHRWAWAAFGAYTKALGTRGRVLVSPTNATLAGAMGVTVDKLRDVISTFPNVSLSDAHEEGTSRHGAFVVTWANWIKYQEDTTRAERARASRTKRREEQNRTEQSFKPPPNPPGGSGAIAAGRPETNGHHPAPEPEPARELLAFLNRKTGHHYRPSTSTLTLIRARLSSGATSEQVRGVIAMKVREWRDDPELRRFLRPETLFRASKFESYLGQLPAGAFAHEEGHDA